MRKITPKKGNIMFKKNETSLPVRIAATVVTVPEAITSVPKGIKAKAQGFVAKVDAEIERRKTVLNIATD